MIAVFLSFMKLRRTGRYLQFGAILLVGSVVIYQIAVWSDVSLNPDADSLNRTMLNKLAGRNHQPDSEKDSAAWISSYTPQTWKPEYKGQANLHVFKDWCGSSTAGLRKNLHYPLFPHSRITVQKLAVTPQQTNYGLRIFGYLHPYTDGDFVFALSSDDNSELWLSSDDSPLNLQLLAWVGKTGREWTAPGEFEKYASQTSRPMRLSAERRYFFEVIHKQNDRGTDHVEVAWRLLDQGFELTVIESKHISLYMNESNLLMGDVAGIPQTTASHQYNQTKPHSAAADMLSEEPRDTFYQVHLINSTFLQGVLPDCSYRPSYTIKNRHLIRYQGLHFVHMSYVYPNDYTRLTHLETENSCFYPNNPRNVKTSIFSRYMRLDHPGTQGKENTGKEFGFQRRKSVVDEEDKFDNEVYKEKEARPDQLSVSGDFEGADDMDLTPAPVWNQTFQLNHLSHQAQQTDAINLGCRLSGNLLLHPRDIFPVVDAFMDQLNKKHHGQFTLVRVINVVKHLDKVRGSLYLLELEVKDVDSQLLRLSHYIYVLKSQSQQKSGAVKEPKPQLQLCNPVGFHWNPVATVHFIVPVKNQARWVLQLISEMEKLLSETGDTNFNLIITDYSSTDMDVKKALENSSLSRYQYVKRSGNFERSAGLQAGINLIKDRHSIVFLCDLHIEFPPSIIDTIRKHCVEGYMAFAPIVMRLDCGSTPLDARGSWEIMGFGLLGIYKSDLDKVGGMNTREFKDRWGGEDWELLDRILQAGLEVERMYVRNFFHHFHSKHGMWVH